MFRLVMFSNVYDPDHLSYLDIHLNRLLAHPAQFEPMTFSTPFCCQTKSLIEAFKHNIVSFMSSLTLHNASPLLTIKKTDAIMASVFSVFGHYSRIVCANGVL